MFHPMMKEPDPLEAIRHWSDTRAQALALCAPGREPLSFQRLWQQITETSGALQGLVAGRAPVVALILPDVPELITAFLGVVSVGAGAPLNPALTESEYEYYLRDLSADAVIVRSGYEGPATAAARSLGIRILEAEWRERDPAGVFRLRGSPDTAAEAWPVTDEHASALLLHTSGTTGRARLVRLTHRNMAAQCACIGRAFELSPRDRFLNMMPLFHLHGLKSSVAELVAGGMVISTAGFDPMQFFSWMEDYRPTWYSGGPTLHRAVLDLVATSGRQPPASLRFVRSTGAVMEEPLRLRVEAALGVPVVEGYGLTETGSVASSPMPPGRRKPGSAGVSYGPQIAILGEAGRLVPPGQQGEILVRGPAVTPGYVGAEEVNRESFYEGWLRTGDLGWLDEDGYLFFTGRIKELINRGGEKVSPFEVEKELAGHPAVAEVAVFGVPHTRLGEDVEAAVVLRPGMDVSGEELRARARERLARHKIPRSIHFVDHIPKGPTGKLKRGDLHNWIGNDSPHGAEAAPAGRGATQGIEARLAEIWGAQLGVKQPRPDSDFFRLGGDSLAAAVMLAEVAKEFGSHPSPAVFFEQPTIANLAALVHLGEQDPEHGAAVIWLRGRGPGVPLYLVPANGSDPYYFRYLAARFDEAQPVYALNPWALNHGQSGNRPMAETVEELAQRVEVEIRQHLPEGPFVLGGHCFGGIVAFEAARRLQASGRRPMRLLLFDVPTPGYPRLLRSWRRYRHALLPMAAAILRGAVHSVARDLSAHGLMLQRLLRRRLRASLRRRIREIGWGEQAAAAAAPGVRIARAAQEYRPGPLKVPVVQFLAAEHNPRTEVLEDERLGWKDFARAGFDTRTTPGAHDSLLVEPHVAHLAAELGPLLEEPVGRAMSAVAGPAC